MKAKADADGVKAQDRATRLAEELRANLSRRKAQARLRRSGDAPSNGEAEAGPAVDGTAGDGDA